MMHECWLGALKIVLPAVKKMTFPFTNGCKDRVIASIRHTRFEILFLTYHAQQICDIFSGTTYSQDTIGDSGSLTFTIRKYFSTYFPISDAVYTAGDFAANVSGLVFPQSTLSSNFHSQDTCVDAPHGPPWADSCNELPDADFFDCNVILAEYCCLSCNMGVCFYAVDELPEETCSMVLRKGRCGDPIFAGCELSCCRYQQDTSSYDLESIQHSNGSNFVSTNMIVLNCLIAAIFFFFVIWHLCQRKHASMTNFLAQHDIVHLPEDKNVQTILPPLRKRLGRPKSESSERQYPPLPNFLGRNSEVVPDGRIATVKEFPRHAVVSLSFSRASRTRDTGSLRSMANRTSNRREGERDQTPNRIRNRIRNRFESTYRSVPAPRRGEKRIISPKGTKVQSPTNKGTTFRVTISPERSVSFTRSQSRFSEFTPMSSAPDDASGEIVSYRLSRFSEPNLCVIHSAVSEMDSSTYLEDLCMIKPSVQILLYE